MTQSVNDIMDMPFMKALKDVHGPETIEYENEDGVKSSITFYYRKSINAEWEEEIFKLYGADKVAEGNARVLELTALQSSDGLFMFSKPGEDKAINRNKIMQMPNEVVLPFVTRLIELGACGEKMKYYHVNLVKQDEVQRKVAEHDLKKKENLLAKIKADSAVEDAKRNAHDIASNSKVVQFNEIAKKLNEDVAEG